MFVITYKNKPITLGGIYELEQGLNSSGYRSLDSRELDTYIATRTKRQAVEVYLHHFGFTWKERTVGLNCNNIRG